MTAGADEEIGAGADSPLTVVLPTKPSKTAMLGVGGGGVLRLIFGWYVSLASQSPYPISVYSVANYRPHLSHFEQIFTFRDPNFVTFYFYELTLF